jgi:hypothetical protein
VKWVRLGTPSVLVGRRHVEGLAHFGGCSPKVGSKVKYVCPDFGKAGFSMSSVPRRTAARAMRRLGSGPSIKCGRQNSRRNSEVLLDGPEADAVARRLTELLERGVAIADSLLEVPRWVDMGSAAGHEGDDHVGGVAVEVLASPVVDGRGPGVGVTGADLDLAQRDAGVKGGHDERGSQHARVDGAEPGTLPDRADPPMRGAPVETWPSRRRRIGPS